MTGVRNPEPASCSVALRIRALVLVGTCVGLLLYHLSMISFGLDVTDHGFQLTNQWLFFAHPDEYRWGEIWLSDWIGGYWMHLAGDPGLLWARAGAAIIATLSGGLCLLILLHHVAIGPAALLVVAATLACELRLAGPIDYYRAPAIFLIAAFACLLRLGDPPRTRRRLLVWSTAYGCLMTAAIMARISLLPALLTPVLLVATRWWHRGGLHGQQIPAMATALIVSVAALVAAVMGITAIGRADQWLAFLHGGGDLAGNPAHDPTVLINRYFWQATEVSIFATIIGGVLLLLLGAVSPRRAPATRLGCGITLATAAAIAMYFGRDWVATSARHYEMLVPGTAVILAVGLLITGRWTPTRLRARDRDLLVVAAALPVFLMAGAATGLHVMIHGAWLIIPAAAIGAYRAAGRTNRAGRVVRATVIGGLILVAIAGAAQRMIGATRDARDLRRMTHQLEHPKLRGVWTHPARAIVVNELTAELDRRCAPGDVVLAYNHIPIVHYLTETIPAMDMPWPSGMSKTFIDRRLAAFGKTDPMPSLVVRATTNARDRDWPAGPLAEQPLRIRRNLERIDRGIASLGFRPTWSNEAFQILERGKSQSRKEENQR